MNNAAAEQELNAAQLEVLERLGRKGVDLPTFDTGLRSDLRASLESALADVAAKFTADSPLFVRKGQLSGVFGCEASFLYDEGQPVAWNRHLAKGTVAHKAIELNINWRPRPEQDLRGDAPGADPTRFDWAPSPANSSTPPSRPSRPTTPPARIGSRGAPTRSGPNSGASPSAPSPRSLRAGRR